MVEQKYNFYNFFIKKNKFKNIFKFIIFYKILFNNKKHTILNKKYFIFYYYYFFKVYNFFLKILKIIKFNVLQLYIYNIVTI